MADLFISPNEQGDNELVKKLFTPTQELIFTSPNPEHEIFKNGVPVSPEQFTLQCLVIEEHFVIFLIPSNPLIKRNTDNMDFLLLLDENGRIRSSNMASNIYLTSAFRGRRPVGRTVLDILSAVDYKKILNERADALAYLQSFAASAKGTWQTALADDFIDMGRWINEEGNDAWTLHPGRGMEYRLTDYSGYLYLKEKVNIEKKDYIVSVSVEQRESSRFAVLLNQAEPTKWDFTGYNCGVHFIRDTSVLTLKKNGRFLFFKRVDLPENRPFTLGIEKTGGLFSFFINGTKINEYGDISPLSNANQAFGILSSGPNLFTRFEIAIRDSVFDPSRSFRPVRVKLPRLPRQVFEVDFFPVENWPAVGLPEVQEPWRFTEVTEIVRLEEDRNLLDLSNRFLRSKDYYGFVGGSSRIISIIDHVEKVADTDAAVSLYGPTGSGKAVLARAIHMRSRRNQGPFIKVDCATIPQGLMESELFGHEKGAFTNAMDRHIGKFESADGGTLFLDEIGNLDMNTQAKLLGFLEDHVFSRVGGSVPMKVDVRIITATNVDLKERVRQGLFREDLYYRINVVSVELPPLSERLEDIPILVEHFLKSINAAHQLKISGIAKPVLETFMLYSWPGNVRELYNALLNMTIVKKEGVLTDKPDFNGRGFGASAKKLFMPRNLRQEAILNLCSVMASFSARDCLKVAPVSLPTIQRDLNRLVRAGKLFMEGKGPSVRYGKKP